MSWNAGIVREARSAMNGEPCNIAKKRLPSGPVTTPTGEMSNRWYFGTYDPSSIFQTERFPFPFFLVNVNLSPDISTTWQSRP